jgi:aminoglycoside 3-N-acetyltransferase
MIGKKLLVTQLQDLGLKPGMAVMLHASMRAVGQVLGGPDEVHQAIMDAITPGGTLMMYISCEREFGSLGRNKLSSNEESLMQTDCPAFDPTKARARRDHGILAEFFRSWPKVVCSDNPGARIAALGTKANWLVADHPLNYGYGLGSPFEKLCKDNGKILLLGSDLDQVTIFHYAEHLSPIENKRVVRFKVPLLQDGKRVWREIEEYDTSDGIRKWPDRFFAYILEQFLHAHSIKAMKVGNADCYLLDAQALVDFAIPIFVEEANKFSI